MDMEDVLDRTYRAKRWMEESDFPRDKRRVLEDLIALSWDNVCGMQCRAAFEQAFDELLSVGVSFALASIDFRNLSGLNQKLGHEGANKVLKEIARGVIQKHARENGGEVYRVGGDEFFVIFPSKSTDDCEAIMKTMSDDADKVVRTHKLDRLTHIKHGGLETGAGGIDYGCVDSVEYSDKKKMLEVADERVAASKLAFISYIRNSEKL